jgi:hypothetical protein
LVDVLTNQDFNQSTSQSRNCAVSRLGGRLIGQAHNQLGEMSVELPMNRMGGSN